MSDDGTRMLTLKEQLHVLTDGFVDRAGKLLEENASATTLHITLHIDRFAPDGATVMSCTPREEVQLDDFVGLVPQ